MEIYTTQKMDTNNIGENFNPGVKIKITNQELQTLRDAADICDKLRYIYNTMNIFDYKEPGFVYEKLLSIVDTIEDHRIGDKVNESY